MLVTISDSTISISIDSAQQISYQDPVLGSALGQVAGLTGFTMKKITMHPSPTPPIVDFVYEFVDGRKFRREYTFDNPSDPLSHVKGNSDAFRISELSQMIAASAAFAKLWTTKQIVDLTINFL